MLSNLTMVGLDERLADLAESYGMIYTRYSDDLAFSTDSRTFSRQTARTLIRESYRVMASAGLRPNHTKTSVVPPGARKIVLGLTVDTERPRIPKQRRRAIRQHVYYIGKLGAAEHARHRGFDSAWGLRIYLEGVLNWAASVEPEFAAAMRQRLPGPDEWPL